MQVAPGGAFKIKLTHGACRTRWKTRHPHWSSCQTGNGGAEMKSARVSERKLNSTAIKKVFLKEHFSCFYGDSRKWLNQFIRTIPPETCYSAGSKRTRLCSHRTLFPLGIYPHRAGKEDRSSSGAPGSNQGRCCWQPIYCNRVFCTSLTYFPFSFTFYPLVTPRAGTER